MKFVDGERFEDINPMFHERITLEKKENKITIDI